MFGFCAASMGAGPLLQGPNHTVIHATHEQIGHRNTHCMLAMLSL